MPNSVLWVCLVVVWLFVLVPMVIKGRPQMRKSTEAARMTRLLHRGGTKTRTSTARRSAGAHPHDPSWTSRRSSRSASSAATSLLDKTESDEEVSTESGADTDDAPTSQKATSTKRATGAKVQAPKADPDVEADLDADDLDADDVESGDDNVTLTGELVDTDETEADEVDDSADASDVVDAEVEDDEAEGAEAEDAELEDDSDVEDVEDEAEYDDLEYDDNLDDEYEDDEYEDDYAVEDDSSDDDYDVEDEYEDDEYDVEDEYDVDAEDDYLDEVDGYENPVPRDKRSAAAQAEPATVVDRGRTRDARRSGTSFDERDRKIRYRERQRVAIALLTFVVISIALGAFLGLIGWIATGITVVMLFAYLAYLRSAVRNEQRLRAQRAARVARQRRQDEERRRREMAAPQFVPVVEPAPQMRRPGGAVVVEIDDEDPIFDHIPPFQRRRVMREDEDFRRAAAG